MWSQSAENAKILFAHRNNLRNLVSMLTYDDLTGFYCLGDLIGTAHLRVADSSYNKNDETWASPAVVLRAGFVLLTGTVEHRVVDRNLLRDNLKQNVRVACPNCGKKQQNQHPRKKDTERVMDRYSELTLDS